MQIINFAIHDINYDPKILFESGVRTHMDYVNTLPGLKNCILAPSVTRM